MNDEPRYRPYRVIKRKTRKGKTVFYVRVIDKKTGEILKECSSRRTSSRDAATLWVERELEKIQEQVRDAGTLASLAERFRGWDSAYARG